MQTFNTQTNNNTKDNDLPDNHKDSYVPFIPNGNVVSNNSLGTPESNTIMKPESTTSNDGAGEYATYNYKPEYAYFSQSHIGSQNEYMGMSSGKFRKMLIGLMAVTLIIFLIIIFAFSRRASYPRPNFPDIYVALPRPGAKLSLPITISGQAQPFWFFNEVFPITMYDKDKIPVGHGFVRAVEQEEPNALGFIPFKGIISQFDFPPQTKKGLLILQRGTGETTPEQVGYIEIPILFSREAMQGPPTSGDTPEQGSDTSIDTNNYDDNSNNGNDSDNESPENNSDPQESPNTSVAGFSGTHSGNVTLYFPNQSNNPWDPSCSQLFALQRNVSGNDLGSVVYDTLDILISGPSGMESGQGYVSGIKSGLRINRIQLSNGTLSIYLNSSSLVGSIDWCTKSDIKNQITKTMRQFAGVENVKIYAGGSLQ